MAAQGTVETFNRTHKGWTYKPSNSKFKNVQFFITESACKHGQPFNNIKLLIESNAAPIMSKVAEGERYNGEFFQFNLIFDIATEQYFSMQYYKSHSMCVVFHTEMDLGNKRSETSQGMKNKYNKGVNTEGIGKNDPYKNPKDDNPDSEYDY